MGTRGVEFLTNVEPDAGVPPGQAWWSAPRSGVRLEGVFAKLSVEHVINMQEGTSK
jgi:hypothetical protein